MMQKLESIDSNLQQGNSVDVPAVEIVIEVKNCTADKEAKVLEFLVKRLNELINNQESGLEEDVPNGVLHKIREILQQTLKDLFALGRHIIRVEQKCILLHIKCTSLTSLISLLRDYRSGQLTRQLHGLQTAFRLFDGCEDVEIDTIIFQDAFWKVMDELVVNLEERAYRRQYALHPSRSHTELSNGRSLTDLNGSRINGLDDIRFTDNTHQENRTGEKKSIRIILPTATHSDQKQLKEYFETGVIDHGMGLLQEEIGQQLQISNVSITAKLVHGGCEKKDGHQIEIPNFPQDHNTLNNVDGSDSPEEVDPVACLPYESLHDISSFSVKNDEEFDSQCIPRGSEYSSSSHGDVLNVERDLKQTGQLIEDSYKALNFQTRKDTRKKVLLAMESVDNLFNSHSGSVGDQTLSDWYEDCAFILNQVEEYMIATRCYYKATVLDSNWSSGRHSFMSDMLWGLTFLCLLESVQSYKNLGSLLTEVEKLAIHAEQLEKWSVCAAIDEDLNKVYFYLRQFKGARNIIKLPKAREPSLRRLARCYYKMGLHNYTRQYCIKILKDTCDYDDAEALEIWARSLFETGDYSIALDKCQLAMKYCKDTDVERLQIFRSDIQSRLNKEDIDPTNPDMEWLAGTNVDIKDKVIKEPCEQKVKTRHYRPKAKDRSKNTTYSLPARRKEKIEQETVVRADFTGKDVQKDKIKLHPDKSMPGRSRNSSLCSTATTETDISAISETWLNNSSSDSDVDETWRDDIVGFSESENYDSISIPEYNHEEEEMEENMSYYEHSYKFHIKNEQSAYSKEVTKNENLLKNGIFLNQDYLDKFVKDKHPSVRKREEFYSSEPSKEQLQQKLNQDPQKYVKCVLHNEGSHEAFCTPTDSASEISVIEITGRSKIGQAFDDDIVVVELLDDKISKDKRYGKVLGVLDRQRHKDVKHPVFICTLDDMDHLVRPVCKTIPKIHVLDREISNKYKTAKEKLYKIELYQYDEDNGVLCNPCIFHIDPAKKESYICLVAYINWGNRHVYPRGAVLKMLPSGSDVYSGLSILNLKYLVPRLYDRETVEMVAKMIADEVDEPAEHHLLDRADFTKMNIFAIGKAEISYAFNIETLDNGYKIGVHIADVATYIPKDSSVDKEAKRRTTTFSSEIRKQRTMIPEPLRAKFCLQTGKRRLTLSVFLYVTKSGRPMQMVGSNYEIVKSYIKCKRHFTEDEAQTAVKDPARENEGTEDIKTLFRVASFARSCRLGNAKYSLDWKDTHHDTIKPKDAVKECLIMVNKKVAERILRSYKQTVPIYYKPAPAKDAIERFLKKYNTYIDSLLRLQDKQIGPKMPKLSECRLSSQTVFLSKTVWEAIAASPKNASQYIQKDELHPLQVAVCSSWRSIQKDWELKCSGSLHKAEVNQTSFTNFTSPLDSYSDLIMQRLIHSAVFQKKVCPYTREEIDSLCLHMNSVFKRARQYNKECRLLQEASKMKRDHVMINCSVEEISEKGLTLCSPFMTDIFMANKEMPFHVLNLSAKPFVFEDHLTKWDEVKVVWRKRLYDFNVHVKKPSDRGQELQLNPYEGVVTLPLHQWAKLLQLLVGPDSEGLSRAIKKANVSHHEGLEDVSTECIDTLEIEPYTTFSMIFYVGKQVKIQFSPAFLGGMITPKPMVYDMTNNVKFCLQHTEDPVLHLYKYSKNTTCDKYSSVYDYLDSWIPILLMESATGVCRNEESCNISNVPVKLSKKRKRKGAFCLSLAHCEIRNIEFSGTISDDDEDEGDVVGATSFDWLCLKAVVPTDAQIEGTMRAIQQPYSIWVGHADITNVKKSKDAVRGGKLTVSFTLCNNSPDFPSAFYQEGSTIRVNIEILRKTEVDRRTESFIKMLPNVERSLAADIALNLPICDLDDSRKHIVSHIDRDLYLDYNTVNPRNRPLPPNNIKQQQAIDKALMARFSLIQGPPGSGKTYTGIKLIYLFNKTNEFLYKEGHPRKQVLFCGPSNKSVDLVAKWMLNRMGKHCPKFVRVYGRSIEAIDFPIPGRTFQSKRSTRSQETPKAVYPVALHHLIRKDGRKYAKQIKELDQLFKDNAYKPMPIEVKKYVHLVREASIDEIRKYDVILCTTAVGSNPKVLQATDVHQVIVDEAGMCTEPQCLVPIIATKAEQVVLIGDHKQLKPIIMCKEASLLGLETSLFERYANCKHVAFTMLEEQYRMNPNICKFPSQEFYEDSLITRPGLWLSKRTEIWPKMDNNVYPHVFVHVEGEEKILTVSTEDGNEHSRSNSEEIEHVVNVYSYLVGMKQSHESVQILSQYNAQCAEIKRKLKEKRFDVSDESVSTVVSSQGGEWDYVIFSTVRSLPEYKIEKRPTLGWCKHNLGFITDRNQINVAITRARKGLVIIGNTKLLACDSVWKNLISHYEMRGCIKTTEQFPPMMTRFSQLLKT
ncbi:helicase with zinc finger domain 2-like isoform X2 [Mercenaria mercenaria]|uniref:helicase with zinc finger domain 2-like isoform X2 n=1 Tax=Mercenaria mercenaria TaxID=6596 RepID=UPI00234F4B49|nr:helicase with zinc finger domain 2-like isoform X2 [Mercenaria mercenaria]